MLSTTSAGGSTNETVNSKRNTGSGHQTIFTRLLPQVTSNTGSVRTASVQCSCIRTTPDSNHYLTTAESRRRVLTAALEKRPQRVSSQFHETLAPRESTYWDHLSHFNQVTQYHHTCQHPAPVTTSKQQQFGSDAGRVLDQVIEKMRQDHQSDSTEAAKN